MTEEKGFMGMEDKTPVRSEGDESAAKREEALEDTAQFMVAHGVTEKDIEELMKKVEKIRSGRPTE